MVLDGNIDPVDISFSCLKFGFQIRIYLYFRHCYDVRMLKIINKIYLHTLTHMPIGREREGGGLKMRNDEMVVEREQYKTNSVRLGSV